MIDRNFQVSTTSGESQEETPSNVVEQLIACASKKLELEKKKC